MKPKREIIKSTQDDLLEFWHNIYYEGSSAEFTDGEIYTHIKRINNSDKCDGECWYYIIQRKSDGKFFRFHVWNAGENNGYLIQNEYLEEVFQKQTLTYV